MVRPLYDLLWWTPFLRLQEELRNSKPHSVAQAKRARHTIFLMSSHSPLSKDMHCMRHCLSVFPQKHCLCHLRSVSPTGGIIGCCAWSCITLSGVVAISPAPWCLHIYICILRQQSCHMRHLTVDEKNEGVSVRTHVYEWTSYGWKQRRELHNISCGQRSASEILTYATVLCVTAESFIDVPAVVLQPNYFPYCCWHIGICNAQKADPWVRPQGHWLKFKSDLPQKVPLFISER